MELTVGQDLYAMCGKCDATWHVIVAMDGPKVTKVQCKQCMGYHRYRAPKGEVDVNKKAANNTTTRRRKVGTRSPSKASKPLALVDLSNPTSPPKIYSIRETFEETDWIMHPKFGVGIVEAIPEPGKITVRFPAGPRTLVHGRV